MRLREEMVNQVIWLGRNVFLVLFNIYFGKLIAQWILNDAFTFTILITGNIQYNHSSL